MANFKDITQVEEIVAFTEGDKIIVNSGGVAKQINALDVIVDNTAAINELSEAVSEMGLAKQDKLPEITADDAGKVLRVSADGKWVVESLQNAEEVPV